MKGRVVPGKSEDGRLGLFMLGITITTCGAFPDRAAPSAVEHTPAEPLEDPPPGEIG